MVRIAFFGTPDFGVPTLSRLLDSPHPVVVAVTRPDRPRGRGQRVAPSAVKTRALASGLPVLQPERLSDPAFVDAFGAAAPDLAVVVAYGKILPASLIEVPRLGFLNVHASRLPKYRGAAPVQRAVMAGEAETGVTIMRVVPRLDAGPVLAAAPRAIGPDETSDAVERDLAVLGADLLVRTLDPWLAGQVAETPQDEAQATYAPRLTKGEGALDWRLPARVLHNRVRGLHPWPLAWGRLEGHRLVIRRTALVDQGRVDTPTEAGAAPGRILEACHDDLIVAAGGGTALAVRELQPEGRRPMTPREFLAGHRIRPGAAFDTCPAE